MKSRILLTNARSYITLDIARQLHASGHEVYVVETSNAHLCKFSAAVKKSFVVPSPRFATDGFIAALARIINEYKIDLLIPIFEETYYIASHLDKLPKSCTVFTLPFEQLEPLHNKWGFMEKLRELGFVTPKTWLIKSNDELTSIPPEGTFALKACYGRASLQVFKVKKGNIPKDVDILPRNPWIAQEWIEGDRFCSYSICHAGKVNATSIYPVEYAIGGTSCLTFKPVRHAKIIAWIERLIKLLNYTGQVGFDFIERADGTLYAIECNPRATSGVHLFNPQDHLSEAFLNTNKDTIYPHADTKKQIAIGMMMYGWKNDSIPNNTILGYLQKLLQTPDVIFSMRDLKPFLFMPYFFAAYVQRSFQLQKPMPAVFTHDIEWNNEAPDNT